MNGNQSARFPAHWSEISLGELAHVQLGKMLDRKRTEGVELQYVRNVNVQWGRIDTSDLLSMHFKPSELERFSLRSGDVLVCEGGEPGRAAVWRHDHSNVKFQKALHRVRLPEGVPPEWLVYQLMLDAQSGRLAEMFTGTTIAHLPREVLVSYGIRMTAPKEIRSIVKALDSYFSRLDEVEAGLERVQRNLKRYRASVLQAAVTGRLVPTEAELARAEGREYEPASELLKRILAERRKKWEESGRRGKYEEPAPPDTSDLPALPEGWCWATVEQVAEVKGGITKNTARRSREPLREVPYLRVANVQRGHLDLAEVTTIPATESEIEELRLQVGDVLFNEGGDRDKLGRGWIWSREIPECIHQNHVFRARLLTDDILPKYLSWYGNTAGQRYFFEEGKQTTNLASINMTKLKGLPVAVPPLSEQRRIAGEVDRLESVAAEEEAEVLFSLHRVRRLRQSILRSAFEGQLVSQVPRDEPEEDLIGPIRAEAAAVISEMARSAGRARRSR